jgi:hypothetical protein
MFKGRSAVILFEGTSDVCVLMQETYANALACDRQNLILLL